MTGQGQGNAVPAAWIAGHASADLLASYATGSVEPVLMWSVEAHLTECGRCRCALSAHADPARLARNRTALLVRVALPGEGPVRRLLGRCGVPDYLFDLVAATPSLRTSWLLSVAGVLVMVAGEAAAVRYGWISGYRNPAILVPFLLVAPLLVLAGVAAAFWPAFDPAHRLAVAAPFSGVRLLLARTVSALSAALVPVIAAAFVVPGPGWLPAALLLPSLALCAFALAVATVLSPGAAALTAGTSWALPALLLAATRAPLMLVQSRAQFACAIVLCASAFVLYLRRDRLERGWMRKL